MKRLKKILTLLFVSVLVIGSCLIGVNVRGYDYQVNGFSYSPYNYLVKVDDLVYNNSNLIALDCTYYASASGNTLTYFISPYQNRIDYDEADYLATYNELIDSTTFVIGEYYFVNDQTSDYLANACLFNVFYNYMIYSYYDGGYATGIAQTNVNDAYNDGYDKGSAYTQAAVDNAIAQTNLINQATIDYLNGEIARLQELVGEDSPTWANFRNLLSTIFMFPVKFFKEGFGVEVWGVNIGYFIIGVFMISITLTIIALVRRGKRE